MTVGFVGSGWSLQPPNTAFPGEWLGAGPVQTAQQPGWDVWKTGTHTDNLPANRTALFLSGYKITYSHMYYIDKAAMLEFHGRLNLLRFSWLKNWGVRVRIICILKNVGFVVLCTRKHHL